MIDRNKTQHFIEEINDLFDTLMPDSVPEEVRDFLKQQVMGAAFEELRELITESRPPRLFLVGRTGHGKSSLINALCGKEVAREGVSQPETKVATRHTVSFPEANAAWDVWDSRGWFDTTKPDGSPREDAVQQLVGELVECDPDVLMYVVSAKEIRGLKKDFEVLEKVQRDTDVAGKHLTTVVVLTHVDVLGDPDEWPPEEYAKKAGELQENMDYLLGSFLSVLKPCRKKLDLNADLRGYRVEGHEWCCAAIPVCALWRSRRAWNIETLQEFIGGELPKAAQLDFLQALRRKELLRGIARGLIKRFSTIAAAVGAMPIPIADIIVLAPLQLLMIGLIGGLSCRNVSKETIAEYTGAMGMTVTAGFGLRWLAQQLVKTLPLWGIPLSASLAGTGTYALGKSAEAFFFRGEVRPPSEFSEPTEEL